MSDGVLYNQETMGAKPEVLEVMMTGGDGSVMNEETLTQVVDMLQMEGQLISGCNHTIIIRQPGTDDIQMIQATSNNGEVVITKASSADIQTLQADASMNPVANEVIDDQQGQVMMVDETGNLVEGVMQLSEADQNISNSVNLDNDQVSNIITTNNTKDLQCTTDLLTNIVKTNGHSQEYLMDSKSNSSAGSTMSATGSIKQIASSKTSSLTNIVIKVDTRCVTKIKQTPLNAIKINTITGTQKYQAPKFHKCEACVINFVSKVAYMNHMESCTKQKKTTSSENSHYSCVFCNNKFNTRVVLMQHVQTCQKAKDSKASLYHSKVKMTGVAGKIKHGTAFKQASQMTNISKKVFDARSKMQKDLGNKRGAMIFDMNEDIDNDLMENDSEDEENEIIYDDDEDMNDEDFDEDNVDENASSRKSQKHLGPIILNGLFKCRDCNRTFTKEHQYNRHVKACTMTPFNASKVNAGLSDVQSLNAEIDELPVPINIGLKKKRGRPIKAGFEEKSPKRINLGPKIVSVDPKKVVAASLQGKFLTTTENEFLSQSGNKLAGMYDDGKDMISKFSMKGNKKFLGVGGANISKIVKVSPSDNIIKKSGKALLSKINHQKTIKALRDNPICGLCGDKFKSNEDLGIHIQNTHSIDLLNLRDLLDGKRNLCSTKCPLCELHFNTNSLLFHMVTFHASDLQSAQEELDMLNLNLLCPYCNSISLSQDLLREHLANKHFDKIVNRPTPSSSPIAIDINKLLKERTNGTNMPVIKQEKVLCPDCNLFIASSHFSHHKCIAERLTALDKVFVCSEESCVDVTFYKIDHLLTHLIQGHTDFIPNLEQSFENLSFFLEWLKDEELQTKMKYTKSVQRLKQGKLCCVWICHQFHNAMKDSSSFKASVPDKLNASTLCYSRIHVETNFNRSTARYDGRTDIKYFSNHMHKLSNIVEKKLKKKELIEENVITLKESDKIAFTNTDDLKSLLEDNTTNSDVSKADEPPVPENETNAQDVQMEPVDVHPNDVEMVDAADLPGDSVHAQNSDMVIETTENSTKVLKEIDSNLVSMADSEEFSLENILGEHDSHDQVPDNFLQESRKIDDSTVETDLTTPNVSCLISSDDKMPEDVLEAIGVNEKPQPQEKNDQVSKDEEKESDVEESTYVLPADLEEWRKLCQLVKNNLEASKLPEEELIEANKVLKMGATIAEEPVEQQVEVFTKLCSMANVHL